MEKEKRRKTALEAAALIVILAVAFSGLWVLAEFIKDEQKVESPLEEITVNLRIIKEDEWTIEYLEVETNNNTVFKLLLEIKDTYNLSVNYIHWQGYDAMFVNSINGTSNGENSNWWQYYVNGIYGEIASDKKEIFDGDFVEWRFEEPGQ
jgi:hypothetical protein